MVERGEVLTKYEALFLHGRSHLIAQYIFYRDLNYFDLNIHILQQNKDEMLKLEIPVGEGEYLGEIPFGYETLQKGGSENVSLRWTGVFSERGALAILNDGVYSSSYENGKLYISLTRTPAYTGHPLGDDPIPVLSNDRYYPRIDQGELSFGFRFVFGASQESVLRTVTALAQEFNEQPYALHMMPKGNRECAYCPLRIQNPCIVLTSFRRKDEGYLLRFHNNYSLSATTEVVFLEKVRFELVFSPFEAVTVFIDKDNRIEVKNEMIF